MKTKEVGGIVTYIESGQKVWFKIGQIVTANNNSDYEGMKGEIVGFASEEDQETDNGTYDIYVDFFPTEEQIKRFKKDVGIPENEECIGFGETIMSAEMLIFEDIMGVTATLYSKLAASATRR